MSKKILFNNNWEFTRQEIGCDIHKIEKDECMWNTIDIPHDWVIYDSAIFHESCEGWYRKRFSIQLLPEEKMHYILRFDGIYMDSSIYVNGTKAGEWKYGYSTFELDITSLLKNGDNEILVRVILQVPNSRWYTGGGIYRNVWLKTVSDVHLAADGIYISTEKMKKNLWKVHASCEIANASQEECVVRYTIYNQNREMVTTVEGNSPIQNLSVDSPVLWDIDFPYLYVMKTELLYKNNVVDEEWSQFGFRTIRFDADTGFYLNERHVKIHGACQHHDLGALGAAVNKTAIRRQLSLLKEMGVNAIRTAHNMCAPELLELADEMGFLVNEESFDMWKKPKNPYDYARFFEEWMERDVAAWIRRDRNHPCIIMWCIGNEIYDTHSSEQGTELTKMLLEQVYKHDPNHNAPVTIGSNYMPWENAQKCADIVKLAGYNYGEKYYELHHKQHKDWMIYGSETGSVVQSRGIYHFPLKSQILCDDDEQCSSLGNSITSWGARSIEKCIIDDRDANFSAGMFIWSGFDYIGEPTPYHTKNCYFGQLDTAGFPKDSFYIYQAEWTDYKAAPMVHIFPYWDFNRGQLIDVRVCSNAPKVELFFNHCSQGTFEINHRTGKTLIGDWQIPYCEGELRAVAYDENNNIIAEDIQRSFSDAAQIDLKPDKQRMLADGQDLIFIEISVKDKNGNPVCNANNRVNVKVTGAGRLIGLDNGDSTDYESYKGTSRRLFSGKLLAIIASKTIPGEIQIKVTSEGLLDKSMIFTSQECIVPEGISALEENKESNRNLEIPIRKLEIMSPLGTSLNKEQGEVEVEVKLYPDNATYSDIEWRLTNATGVDTNIAAIAASGKKAKITALGDGEFYVRATAQNGSEKIRLISVLDFKISGLGTAYYNPYEFVSGSLYTRSSGEIGSGNERGAATARDGESIIVFDKLDFGNFGSDEITIPIFELGSKATQIEIWEGAPYDEGSELLADVIYHKPSIWNTYQEETYQLKKRLSGITSIAFLLRDKVHMKGFIFKKLEKAYEKLSVLSYSSLYGDSYQIDQDSITGIGNNVTIEFDEMDFGTSGFHKLIICGRSPIEKNTIHVRFYGASGEVKQLAEFEYAEEYIEREFLMDSVTGLQTVSFIFLPGCHFDFKWFKFQ
ncbi:glycoside hydrolase family 2 TIM barrel-domain containing protein [Anaeromicropila populeti]|uniref:Beta-galactosidase n=1 Tax=Anaeromicropila populeti TaxID=37658 RepID=A0A1I6JI73_9FIRM|nr:glycoside hydrolase family 2 TIM barrel-domain containing protein [Anaeromicropila populeti]SFR78320.1 beta-galactosidase [Anaeromicropila populeti]